MAFRVEFADDMLSDFLDEASQLVDRLNEDLLRLDESVRTTGRAPAPLDHDLLNSLFRSAHSMKGLSAMLGLENINRLIHRVENLLDAARRSELTITSRVMETIAFSIDRLSSMLDQLRRSGTDECDLTDVIDAMEKLLSTKQEQSTPSEAEETLDALSCAGAIIHDDIYATTVAVATHGQRSHATLRVEIERLDQLMNLAGDLRSLIGRITLGVARMLGEMEQINQFRSQANELLEAADELGRVSAAIQKSVRDTRMAPIGPLFQRFRRVVREVTRANGREVQLVVRGEKTVLDKQMIDELIDPLIQIVRNAADHGIELPEIRLGRGKPRQGAITLDAFHRGDRVMIQVTDDGSGLDRERIVATGIERQIITSADVRKMSPTQVDSLIWEPGFSTAQKVTEISGRGIGLDIVRAKIEGMNGSVHIDNRPGEGCTFTIALPRRTNPPSTVS